MRILHVITRGDVGGAQTQVLELATAQLAQGHEVSIAAGSPGAMVAAAAARGVRVIEILELVRSVSVLADVRAVGRVRKLLEAERPDVVHAHSSKAGLLVRLSARRCGVPTVYTAHGWPFQQGAPVLQRLVSWAGEWVAGRWWGEVICVAEAERARALRAFVVPRSRLHVVANGLPDVTVSRRERPSGRIVAIMVARVAPPKDHAGAMRAMALLDDDRCVLRFVGGGPGLEEAKALARDLDIERRVEFLGDRDDVAELLAEADVGLLWSRYEGMPLAVLEAMRAGLPVIVNELPGAVELLGSCGVVTPHDPAALADALRILIDDPPRAAQLGACGHRRFVEHFSIERSEQATADVYRVAISRARR